MPGWNQWPGLFLYSTDIDSVQVHHSTWRNRVRSSHNCNCRRPFLKLKLSYVCWSIVPYIFSIMMKGLFDLTLNWTSSEITPRGLSIVPMKCLMVCIAVSRCVVCRHPSQTYNLNKGSTQFLQQPEMVRAMLLSRSPCFPLTPSYPAVSHNYVGHQLAVRR